jgi:hypothetical protein
MGEARPPASEDVGFKLTRYLAARPQPPVQGYTSHREVAGMADQRQNSRRGFLAGCGGRSGNRRDGGRRRAGRGRCDAEYSLSSLSRFGPLFAALRPCGPYAKPEETGRGGRALPARLQRRAHMLAQPRRAPMSRLARCAPSARNTFGGTQLFRGGFQDCAEPSGARA